MVQTPGGRDDNADFEEDAAVTVSFSAVRKIVFEEITAHCDSVRGYAATLPEFEAKLIAGCVVHRLRQLS
jgi:hypothetical protein